MLKAAVEAGKDAYVEKPFGVTFDDSKAAYLAVKRSRQVVQVGTQRRSDGHFMAAAKIMHSGILGKVARIEIAMNAQGQRWKRASENVNPADVDWDAFRMGRIDRPFDQSLLREWQLHKETTNGIPGLWMCHFIDLVPWFMDDPYPASAVSNGGIYLWKDGRDHTDVFYTLLDYPKGFLVDFSMTLITNAGIQDCWYGTKGYLDCEKWIVSGEGSTLPDRVSTDVKIQPEVTNSHMHNFLECVRSRGIPRADVQAGFSHAVAGIMSAEAYTRARKVRFDPVKLELL
jgi:predicted dehydrogenase